jgi:hypothetical protein
MLLDIQSGILELDSDSEISKISPEFKKKLDNYLFVSNGKSFSQHNDRGQWGKDFVYWSKGLTFALLIEYESNSVEGNLRYNFNWERHYFTVCNIRTGIVLFSCMTFHTGNYYGDLSEGTTEGHDFLQYNIFWDSSFSSFVFLDLESGKLKFQIKINHFGKENQEKPVDLLHGLDLLDVESLLKLGEKCIDYKHYNEAIAIFSKAIFLDTKCAKAYKGRALSKEKINDLNGSYQDYCSSIELETSDPNTFFYRACLRNELNDPLGAIIDLDQAILLLSIEDPEVEYPILSDMYFIRAKIKSVSKDKKGAVQDFLFSMDLNNAYENKELILSSLNLGPVRKNYITAIQQRNVIKKKTKVNLVSSQRLNYNDVISGGINIKSIEDNSILHADPGLETLNYVREKNQKTLNDIFKYREKERRYLNYESVYDELSSNDLYTPDNKPNFNDSRIEQEISILPQEKEDTHKTINQIKKQIGDEKQDQDQRSRIENSEKDSLNNKYALVIALGVTFLFFIFMVSSGQFGHNSIRIGSKVVFAIFFLVVYLFVKLLR